MRKLDRMIERSWQRHADRLFKQDICRAPAGALQISMGKGSKPRPIENLDVFRENWDKIFTKKQPANGTKLPNERDKTTQ